MNPARGDHRDMALPKGFAEWDPGNALAFDESVVSCPAFGQPRNAFKNLHQNCVGEIGKSSHFSPVAFSSRLSAVSNNALILKRTADS
jgi:hypothetical protein